MIDKNKTELAIVEMKIRQLNGFLEEVNDELSQCMVLKSAELEEGEKTDLYVYIECLKATQKLYLNELCSFQAQANMLKQQQSEQNQPQ